MSFRQDKLILLLDTGSNSQVRRTAGKQIADLAGKTFRASVEEPKRDVKEGIVAEGSQPVKEEDNDIKPNLESNGETKAEVKSVTINGAVSEEDAWTEVLETVAKVLPLLKSKASDTRHAAAHTLGLLAGTLPGWTHPSAPFEPSPPVHLPTLLRDNNPLLASAGREYAAKPAAGDKAKRRKAMMGSLGLGDAVGWGEDVDQVIGDEDEDVDMSSSKANGNGANVPPPKPPAPPKDMFEGLSARQIAMLKRKKGNIEEEANKMRKLNAAASGVSPSPSGTPTPAPSPSPAKMERSDSSSNVVTIDPGAKARAVAASGGAVEPTEQPVQATPKISFAKGQSPWQAVLLEVIPNLSDAMWQARHGANLAILEIIRSSNLPGDFLLHIARHLLALLALDRFGDFVGDTVIAPVRETAAQALGVVLKQLDMEGAREVHVGLMGMVLQSWAKRGRDADGLPKYEKFAWEVRHAGLLGLKYEVAVRVDLLDHMVVGKSDFDIDEKTDVKAVGVTFLQDVVNATSSAMRDQDDDVRTVAAAALLPITPQLASQLSHDELSSVLDTLWDCLAEGGDELGSSTGAIMDLLGALIAHQEVMQIMAEDSRASGPRLSLISRIYPFIRHPIQTVRLSVAKALHIFATVPSLPRTDWILEPFFQLLFQNLVLEQNVEIRRLSLAAFEAALSESASANTLNDVVAPNVEEWYKMVMTPVGTPLDSILFLRVARSGSYNVDKPMMEGDLGLISTNTVLETRLVAAKALALLRRYQLDVSDLALIKSYLSSGTAHQVFASAVIIQEWAFDIDTRSADHSPLPAQDEAAKELSAMLITRIESPPPATYAEMTTILTRVASECLALLTAFTVEAKVSKDRVPSIPRKVDPLSNSSDVFSLASAQSVVGPTFDALSRLLTKNAIKTVLPSLEDRRRKVMGSLGYFSVMKERYDIQVESAIAGALIALRTMPGKFGPVIKAVMESVKKEENEVLQIRSADLVGAFVEFCGSPHFTGKVNPCPKVIKNLWTFLCSDTSVTPIFSPTPGSTEEGIISLKEEKAAPAAAPAKKRQDLPTESEEQIARRTTRIGALAAFKAMARRFEARLFDSVPAFWEGISAALTAAYPAGTTDADASWAENVTAGQDLVDCLTSLRLVAPEIHPSLHPRLVGLLPQIVLALQSGFAVVRYTAAKCLAALCDVILDEGMKFVVDEVVPLIGDAKRVSARQGATEAIYHIIKVLDIKALPYVLFLIVPILGRMSDSDDQVRLLSTSTFASLVKMVPLEAGIPDPPGFSAELLARRDEERKFLMQLLDGSKAEQYQVPITIKADLRQYQRDGVSWLAFLAKYQLHGILCDDMGLGKSLQSICIIGSKHFERAEKHKLSQSVDSAHLPSLIVCPPTLTGHWYYEVLKFTDYLRPFQYVGSSSERAALRSRLTSHDVVIASYETIRADIAELSKIDWLYCVLDEGHIIKNAKTKLSAAVKQLKAQHRLLLSGTPIQNNVLELWSLFDFLMPGFLGSERAFNDKFSKPILADRDGKATPKEREAAAAALEALHKQVLPFLLRRLKEDVLHDLPPKIIQDYYCELSAVQKHLYDEFSNSKAAEDAGEEVNAESSSGQGHVFQSLQYLRKLCNHPALVLQGEPQRFEEIRAKVGGDAGGIHDIRHSPKLLALQQLLLDCGIGLSAADKAGAAGEEYNQHRVLIFCQLRPMLDLIETDLFKKLMPSVSYMRMDGSTDPRKRHAVVQTFNNDPRIDVLLLTTSVGGLGLNLTGADTVIFVDHDWNPMKDLQAMDRAHRLGQKKVVNVYRLITRGTLEEKIMGLQRFKLNIASSVVTQQNAGLGSMNTGEVLDLFKVSAEGEAPKPAKATSGPASASKILEGLEELPPDDEYAELSLSNFMSKV